MSSTVQSQDAQPNDAGSAVVYELSEGVPFQSGSTGFVVPGAIDGSYFSMNHIVGDGIGYDDSFSTFQMFQPLFNGPDSMWYFDGRINLRNNFLNNTRMGGNLGWGFRQFFDATGVGWGASVWWDIDDTHQNLYHQVGVSLERFGQFWDWRTNGYFPIGNSRNALAFSATSNQLIFVGNAAALARTRFDEAALKGFDMEWGTRLYGRIAEQFNIRGYGGFYHYQGNEGSHVWGGRARLQANFTPNTAVQLLATSDGTFGNNVVLGLTMYLGNGSAAFPVRNSNVTVRGQSPVADIASVPTHRINQPVQRQYMMAVANQAVSDPVIQALANGGSLIHVDSTAAAGGDGTFANPFQTLAEAQAGSSANDIIIAHAGSDFAAGGQTIQLQQGQQLLGDGKTHFVNIAGMGLLPLPQGNPDSTAVPIFGGIGLANDVLVSSVQVNQPTVDQFGFFADGVTTTATVNCFTIVAGNGIQLLNSTGTFNFSLPNTIDTTGTSSAIQVSGGSPTVVFDGNTAAGTPVAWNNSNSRLIDVQNAGAATNMTFSNVTMNDTGGQGVVVDNLSGNMTVNGDVNITSATTNGVTVLNSSGTVDFNGDVNIASPAGMGVNIDNSTGTFTFGNAAPGTEKLTITSATGTAFNVNGGSPTINGFMGTGNTNTAGRLIAINNTTGGTINLLEGDWTDSGAGANTGMGILVNNAASTITVGGQLTLTETDGAAGIDIVGGTAAINFSSALNNVTDPDGIPLRIDGGTTSVTYAGNLTQQRVATDLVRVFNGHDQANDGTGGIVTLQNGILLDDIGTGLQFVNADGTYNVTSMLNLRNNSVTGDAGIDIIDGGAGNNSDGVFTFTNVANQITSPTGIAFNVNNGTAQATYAGTITKANTGSTVAITNHAVGTLANQSNGNINFDAATINTTDGDGLQFNNADGVYSFAATTGALTLNGGDAGVDIVNGSGGTFTFGRAGANAATITDPTGTAFRIGDGVTNDASTVTYIGSITQTTNGQRVLDITGITGGTINFMPGTGTGVTGAALAPNSSTGAIIQNNTGGSITVADLNLGTATNRLTNDALTINNNTGTNITLTDVDIFTDAADAILMTNNASGTITFGDTDINTTGAGADGILISNNNPTSASYNFATTNMADDLTILTATGGTGSGNGFVTSGTGVVGPIAIDTVGATFSSRIQTTGGQALAFTAASTVIGTSGIRFNNIQADGSGSATVAAVQFDNVSGGTFETINLTVNDAAGTGLGDGLEITQSSATFTFDNQIDIDDTGLAGIDISNNMGTLDVNIDDVNIDNATGQGINIVGNATGASIDFLPIAPAVTSTVTITGVNANAAMQADGVFVQNDNAAVRFRNLSVNGNNTARRGIRIETSMAGIQGSFEVGTGLTAAANNPGDGGVISNLDGAMGTDAISLQNAPNVTIRLVNATGINDAVDINHTGSLTSAITLENNQLTSGTASIGVDINDSAGGGSGPLTVNITGGDGAEFIQGGTVGVDFNNNGDATFASTLNITNYNGTSGANSGIRGQDFGVNINANGAIGGAVTATVTGNRIEATGGTAANHAFNAVTAAPTVNVPTPGGLTLDFSGNTLRANGGTAVNLNGSAQDSNNNPIALTLNSFFDNDVESAGNGGFVLNAVVANNVTAMAGTESTISGVSGGQITGTTGGNGAVVVLEGISGTLNLGDVNIVVDNTTTNGVFINNSGANISFADLDINGQNNVTNGLVFTETNSGNLTVNAVGADVSTFTGLTGVGVQIDTNTNAAIITLNEMTINSEGNAIDIDRNGNADLTLVMNDIMATSTGATSAAIDINGGGMTGQLNITQFGGATSGIQATGVANGIILDRVNFANVTGTTLAATSAGGDALQFTNTSGSLTGVAATINNTMGDGVVLSGATGTLSFADLDITNTGGNGLFADVASTVTLSTTGTSTVSTTTGSAINLDTMALGGLTFASVTADNAAAGGNTVGIVLNNVTGQFTSQGGTISSGNTATNGVSFTNYDNVTLTGMTFNTGTAAGWTGINATTNVNGATLVIGGAAAALGNTINANLAANTDTGLNIVFDGMGNAANSMTATVMNNTIEMGVAGGNVGVNADAQMSGTINIINTGAPTNTINNAATPFQTNGNVIGDAIP